MTGGAQVQFRDLTVRRGGVVVLEKVNARVPSGGCTVIVGPNGSGKTTLLLALLGLLPSRGKVIFEGESRPKIGYVPQRLNYDRSLPLTVTEFLALGFTRRPIWTGVSKPVRQEARRLLSLVHAGGLCDRVLGVLSGGELQRVLLAQALARGPKLLILDEPADGVDFHGEQLFCELLDQLREKLKFTQLMVSHDLSMVTAHATHVICLNKKVLAEGSPNDVLRQETLTATFGLHMGVPDFSISEQGLPSYSCGCPKHGNNHA